MRLRAGEWVQVRSKEEILSTLDENGCLGNLPFMPQMFKYCGQRFRVYKRAHKTCDWLYTVKARRVRDGVHLETRCDGESYGGCQTACLIYWKEAWLMRVEGPHRSTPEDRPANPARVQAITLTTSKVPNGNSACTEARVLAATRAAGAWDDGKPRYVCQATQVMEFTTPLPWWDFRQYVEDYTSGNASLGRLLRAFIYAAYDMPLKSGIGIGRPMIWIYDRFQALWGGRPYPRNNGPIPPGQRTPAPAVDPNLQPGQLVRVRPMKEILATLNKDGKNRGLGFDGEMTPYCGGVYRIRTRVTRFVDEKTGELTTLSNPSFILEGVVCTARYARCRMLCPRSIYPWWREIWLERVPDSTKTSAYPAHPSDR
ncbi:MAG: hypothetical protein U1F54_16100 [Burkholderiales bacterium]